MNPWVFTLIRDIAVEMFRPLIRVACSFGSMTNSDSLQSADYYGFCKLYGRQLRDIEKLDMKKNFLTPKVLYNVKSVHLYYINIYHCKIKLYEYSMFLYHNWLSLSADIKSINGHTVNQRDANKIIVKVKFRMFF